MFRYYGIGCARYFWKHESNRILKNSCFKAVRQFSSTAPRKAIPGLPFDPSDDGEQGSKEDKGQQKSRTHDILFKCLETAGITFASLAILGLAGYSYHEGYQIYTIQKIEKAFKSGDPAFELKVHSRTQSDEEDW